MGLALGNEPVMAAPVFERPTSYIDLAANGCLPSTVLALIAI